MIKTRKEFEYRLRELMQGKNKSYKEGIEEVLKLIEDEGGCFKDECC